VIEVGNRRKTNKKEEKHVERKRQMC